MSAPVARPPDQDARRVDPLCKVERHLEEEEEGEGRRVVLPAKKRRRKKVEKRHICKTDRGRIREAEQRIVDGADPLLH